MMFLPAVLYLIGLLFFFTHLFLNIMSLLFYHSVFQTYSCVTLYLPVNTRMFMMSREIQLKIFINHPLALLHHHLDPGGSCPISIEIKLWQKFREKDFVLFSEVLVFCRFLFPMLSNPDIHTFDDLTSGPFYPCSPGQSVSGCFQVVRLSTVALLNPHQHLDSRGSCSVLILTGSYIRYNEETSLYCYRNKYCQTLPIDLFLWKCLV